MTHVEFRRILIERITKMQDVLDAKGKEYASDADRLHNFKSAAGLTGSPLSFAANISAWELNFI